jgi:hypothetical protein
MTDHQTLLLCSMSDHLTLFLGVTSTSIRANVGMSVCLVDKALLWGFFMYLLNSYLTTFKTTFKTTFRQLQDNLHTLYTRFVDTLQTC